MLRLLLSIFGVLVAFAIVACGGGGDTGASTTASPASVAAQEPLEVVRATLDAVNRQDVDAAYANLSTDARKEVDLKRVQALLTGLKDAGIDVAVTIDTVGETDITGDMAEIELGLSVKFGESTVPVNDTASLVKEDGQWRISDHFLQTALVAAGLATPMPQAARQLGADGCAIGDPLAGVYAPSRLKVLNPCITVEGTVGNDITKALDGDITFGLEVSGDDLRLLNDANIQNEGGALHIEIVPLDQTAVSAPQPGQRVRVTGPWVTDLVHGHNEIHPAFRIQLLP